MVLGRSIRRLEDRPLLTGQGRFAADIDFPGQLHMRVVRSPVAFGRLLAIEVDEAQAMAGVAAVWTGRDVAAIPPIDFRQVRVPGLEPYRQPILAQDFLRYVGEPLAVVFADDPYRAEDAAELVFAEIEELEPCLDATGEPCEFLPGVSTEAAMVEKAYGDLEQAFAAAHVVVELQARGRPAQRCAVGNPRRDRPLRPGRRPAGAAWRGEDPAHQPAGDRPHARSAARADPPL